jgi:23S rRNA pseudouridine2457 synthase
MPKIYIALHKPFGVLSQFTGEAQQRTLAEFNLPKEVYAAGRLDKDSEGLLLLTDDGPLKHKLLHPKNAHKKTYWVQVEGIPTPEAIHTLQKGVIIKGGYKTKPCNAKIIHPEIPDRIPPIRKRENIPTSWLSITIHEGKNRQVRRMTAKIGYPTLRLIRVQIEGIQLDALPQGQWKRIQKSDIFSIR